MNITERLQRLGYEKIGSFEKGLIQGKRPFGEKGYTIFNILLDVAIGNEVVTKRTNVNPRVSNGWDDIPTVDEMQLALEIIYSYREWKGEQNV